LVAKPRAAIKPFGHWLTGLDRCGDNAMSMAGRHNALTDDHRSRQRQAMAAQPRYPEGDFAGRGKVSIAPPSRRPR
jgi:hypothetical protein